MIASEVIDLDPCKSIGQSPNSYALALSVLISMMLLISIVNFLPFCLGSCAVPRRASREYHIDRIEKQIRAVDWRLRDDWIHHDPYNIIDAFGLTYEEVMEARDLTMQKFNLKQI